MRGRIIFENLQKGFEQNEGLLLERWYSVQSTPYMAVKSQKCTHHTPRKLWNMMPSLVLPHTNRRLTQRLVFEPWVRHSQLSNYYCHHHHHYSPHHSTAQSTEVAVPSTVYRTQSTE
ncbi:hypothetical protein I7I48_01138 [Histoplasma ohiense]|nr:hypothetical protein I7I48_01138 [Histoplasma ohiense (nom. inval.)]